MPRGIVGMDTIPVEIHTTDPDIGVPVQHYGDSALNSTAPRCSSR